MQKRNFTISGYTTTYNCVEMRYPFRECIQSLLGFCDEVIVVDAGSSDGTIEELQQIAATDSRFKFFVEPVDFKHPRWAIYQDGYLKAKARARCTGDYCWQTDTDEIVHPNDFDKMKYLPMLMGSAPMLMLPMVEFWGGFDRIRADFFSWKTRFSKNDPRITHGIPECFRLYDETGHEYCRPYDSDSCNYIYRDSLENLKPLIPIPSGFGDLQQVLRLSGNMQQNFFHRCLDELPSVQHVSWLDLERKIDHYRRFWGRFHASMYNLHIEDTAANNVMFEKPWSEVTDSEIRARASDLQQIGPRSFHRKIDWNVVGATMPFERPVAESLLSWKAAQPPFGAKTQSPAAPSAPSCAAVSSPSVSPELEQTLQYLRECADTACATKAAASAATLSRSRAESRSYPLVSAIVPSYNKAQFLRDSVGSLIAQDYPNLEIIIVSDGSPDNTADVAAQLIAENPQRQIRYLEKQNGGISDARNFGIKAAAGGIILTLDADDICKSGFISAGVSAMQQEGANIVCSDVELFGIKSGFWEPPHYDSYFIRYTNSIPSMPLFEKRLWELAGGLSPAFAFVEDWDFWVRCSKFSPVVVKIPGHYFRYRASTTGLADIFTDRHTEVQSMIITANEELFAIDEILKAAETAATLPPEFYDKFRNQLTLHPQQWVLHYWLGLDLEARGQRNEAFEHYKQGFELSEQKNWQPAYRLSLLLSSVGNREQTVALCHLCRTLRPDTRNLVNPLIDRNAPLPDHNLAVGCR